MSFFNQHKLSDAKRTVTDKAAAIIAKKLISVQMSAAQFLHNKLNRYSTARKKTALAILITTVSIFLVTGLFSSFYNTPILKTANYPGSHIGMPSGAAATPHQLTDSLTKNLKTCNPIR